MFRVTKADTPEARAVWEDVAQAAANCPEWVRPQVEQAAKEMVDHILEREQQGAS